MHIYQSDVQILVMIVGGLSYRTHSWDNSVIATYFIHPQIEM